MDIYDESVIPSHMLACIKRYVEDRIECGGFLDAVLRNDLSQAVGRADSSNMKIIPNYVCYLANSAPASCWGSDEKVAAWLASTKKGISMDLVV